MNDTLDELLAGAAPAVSPRTPDAEAVLAEMVADARVGALRGQRAKVGRRVGGAVAVVALMAVGTAAAAGVLPGSSQGPAWNGPPPPNAQVFEWTSVDLSGRTCVDRLSGTGLSDDDAAAIEAILNDPAQLLSNDDGAVRKWFLEEGSLDGSPAETAAIDAAYAEVARLDLRAGRGTLTDAELTGGFAIDQYEELFDQVYWRLIDGAIKNREENGSARVYLNPETACEVAE